MKINEDGSYIPFFGWSVISEVKNDLKFLENYLIYNNHIKNHFTPLPSSSYHVTLYNIWCISDNLLECQKKELNNYSIEKQQILLKKTRNDNYFNHNRCMDNLLYKLHSCIIKEKWHKKVELEFDKVYYNGSTIGISFKSTKHIDYLDNIRSKMINLCKKDDNMRRYHITLAYQYKSFNEDYGEDYGEDDDDEDEDDEDKLMNEISKLNILLSGQTFTLYKPDVYYFNDMTKFNVIE